MKNLLKITIYIVISFVFIIELRPIGCCVCAKNCSNDVQINLVYNNNKISVNDYYVKYLNLSMIQEKYVNLSISDKINLIHKLTKMGFNNEAIVKYLFPGIYDSINDNIKNIEYDAENAKINIIKNFAKIEKIYSKKGLKVDKNQLYCEIINKIINKNHENINIKAIETNPIIEDLYIDKISYKRSEFETNFINSIKERKNNIKLALESLDGVCINPGEIFSFNDIVGERSSARGYESAKIISRGEFVDAIGGGVCQVSTTLYNAALLAGLDIIEVNSHSLRIGYIEPGFDAMVNSGSSDLKFRNNTEYPIMLATSNNNDTCKICIYGEKNPYQYKREYSLEYNRTPERDGYTVLQEGSTVESKIYIYKNGDMVEEKKLRSVKYKPIIKHVSD